MKNIIILYLVLIIIPVEAQEYQNKNLIKVNSMSLVFNNASFIYERAIISRLTASLGLGYKYAGSLPRFIFGDTYQIHLKMLEIKGFTITPEVRYYLKSCDEAFPSGLYFGLYYRYTRYNSGFDIRYIHPDETTFYYTTTYRLNEHGIGIQIGYQLQVTKWLCIDFLIMGPRQSFYNLIIKFDENLNSDFIATTEGYLQDLVDDFGLSYNVKLSRIDTRDLKSKFSFLNWRYGLAIGISF